MRRFDFGSRVQNGDQENRETLPASNAPRVLFQFAFWIHWIMVLLIVVDVGNAQHLGYLTKTDWVIGLLAALWLLVVSAVYFAGIHRASWPRLPGVLLAFYTCAGMLLAFEFMVRMWGPPNTVYDPRIGRVTKTDAFEIHGITGTARFTTNDLGLRGPELPQSAGVYRVITVGGSTTACTCMDDGYTWPARWMTLWNAEHPIKPLWVANAGMDGLNTANHINFLKTVPALRAADALIFLIGVNDLNAALSFEGRPCDRELRNAAARIFADQYTFPVFHRMAVFDLARKVSGRLGIHETSHEVRSCVDARGSAVRRSRGPFLPIPDLRLALTEYHQRVVELARACSNLRKRCIFLTQPSIWTQALPYEEDARLWMGWLGPIEAIKGFAKSSDMAVAMKEYNDVLVDTCSAMGLECYDLAGAIAREGKYFSDDVHFTVAGAELVAEYLLAHVDFDRDRR
jgi:lysophospholipase L1-like esterase